MHRSQNDHRIAWDNASVLCKQDSFIERNLIESVIIQNTKDVNINLSSGLYSFDAIMFKHLISFLAVCNK